MRQKYEFFLLTLSVLTFLLLLFQLFGKKTEIWCNDQRTPWTWLQRRIIWGQQTMHVHRPLSGIMDRTRVSVIVQYVGFTNVDIGCCSWFRFFRPFLVRFGFANTVYEIMWVRLYRTTVSPGTGTKEMYKKDCTKKVPPRTDSLPWWVFLGTTSLPKHRKRVCEWR